tara:strand:- start:875 stop:1669 length:795 start_codon:yes stop_codon:yes gene_type:complete
MGLSTSLLGKFPSVRKKHRRPKESPEVEQRATPIGSVYVGSEPIRERHYRGVCNEVIKFDCYGVQKLKEEGFSPKVIVDLGGHIGTFSLMAHRAWPEAQIFTLEVLQDEDFCGSFARAIARALDSNTQDIENITVLHKALIGFYGEKDADIVHGVDFGKKGLIFEDKVRLDLHRWAEALSVRDLLQTQNIDSIDLLKIDVEGCEVNILREFASLGFLEKIDKIRGEWHFDIARTEVERLLSPTHHVDIHKPEKEWNTFTADRKE